MVCLERSPQGCAGDGRHRSRQTLVPRQVLSESYCVKAKFQDRELLQQFQEVERLPDEDKTVIGKLLDAFLTKKHLYSLVRPRFRSHKKGSVCVTH